MTDPVSQSGASSEAADLSSWMEAPHRLAVDAKGYVWRAYEDEGYWSMAPVNPDNSPIPQPVTYYVPDPYANRPEGVSYEHEETTLDIRRDDQDGVPKLLRNVLLARRGVGVRTLRRRVVSRLRPGRPGPVRTAERRSSPDWRPSLRQRVKLALAVLRGRQRWGDGYPTPWAYEQVCATLRRERGQ